MKNTILINREDAKRAEAEEQYKFVKMNLEAMGLNLAEVLPEDYQQFTVEKKIKLRNILDTFKVVVLDDRNGGIKIFIYDETTKEKEIMAEWKKCRFDLRVDGAEPNPAKRIYMAMHIEWWSVFEDQNG